MRTSEAIQYILEHDKAANKYRLAKELGVSHTTINKWLSGSFCINSILYKKLLNIYPSIEIDDVREIKEVKLGKLEV